MASIIAVRQNPCHIRSISEPSASHPLVATVEEENKELKAWKTPSAPPSSLTAETICNGLRGLKGLYDCTEDPLHLSLALHQNQKLADDFLDESVRLLDACSRTIEILLQTKEHVQDLRSVLRRSYGESNIKDNVEKYISSMKMVKKDISKCICELQRMETRCTSITAVDQDQHSSVVARLLNETKLITIFFLQTILLFVSTSGPKPKTSKWSLVSRLVHKEQVAGLDKDQKNMNEAESVEIALSALLGCTSAKGGEMEKVCSARRQMEVFEPGIERLEGGLECMFKRLIQAQVALLNILSH